MKQSIYPLIVLCASVLFAACTSSGMIKPVNLRVENRIDPSVIDTDTPRLSWINEVRYAAVTGAVQSAYHILVASSEDLLNRNVGDMWDSGKVDSDASYLVAYAGDSLLSGRDYWWKVQVWDNNGKNSGWSETARFGMGLDEVDWTAQWIGAPWQGEEASADYKQAPVFSKTFTVDTVGLVSAKAFVSGLGYFELELNGEKVGDDYFVPNVTNYGPRPGLDKARLPMYDNYTASRVLYLAYDIEDWLRCGVNRIDATVGNGFYNSYTKWIEPFGSPRFICQIRLEYADGRVETVATDGSWTAARSPIVFNDLYNGEVYDANVVSEPVPVAVRKAPEGQLTAHTAPTDKILRTLKPLTVTANADGSSTFDFGEEVTGWLRLQDIVGDKGDTVTVRYHYGCNPTDPAIPGMEYHYVMNGDGEESCAPKFTWYTFSSATVSGFPGIDVDNVVAEVVGTDVAIDSEFNSSDTLLNQIVEIWCRTQSDNMHGGIPSDCPHRERNAYTGDGQVTSAMVMSTYDAAAFYEKWLRDIRDAQHDDGYVPNAAPWQPGCGGGVPWGAAINIIPWEYYLAYGDVKALADNYDAMKAHTDNMTTWLTPDGTMHQQRNVLGKGDPLYWFNLGEWCAPDKLPSDELVHTFYLWMCADITARSAKVLGHDDDANKYSGLARQIKNAFHAKFYDADAKSYGRYGSNVFALVMGVPAEVEAGVVESLRREIEAENDSHLDTGIYGTRYLFEVLSQYGLADLGYKVMTQSTYPSFGHWIDRGATTMWECWDGSNSHNHPMFGGGLVWLYRGLAGINYDPEQPGFRHVIVRPTIVAGLEYVSYTKNTPYGKVSSRVTNTFDDRSIDVTVPVGSTATVYLPGDTVPVTLPQGSYHIPFWCDVDIASK